MRIISSRVTALLAAGAVSLAGFGNGCSPNEPGPTALAIAQPTGPDALARYVAIGDALTAGYMDNGLIAAGQLASYPAQIAGRLGYTPAPGGAQWFAQPLVAWPGIGGTRLPDPGVVAGVLCWNGTAIALAGSTPAAEVTESLLPVRAYPTPYHNLAVPGATLPDVATAFDDATSQPPGNPFFAVVLRNPAFGDVAMVDQAIAQGPTLVTVWLGAGEAIGAAASGQPAIGDNLIAPADFNAALAHILERLVDGVAARYGYTPQFVVGNVPQILALPHFIPKGIFDALVGSEFPTVEMEVSFVLFPALAAVQNGFAGPLAADVTLTAAETAVVESAVLGYNAAIAELAASYGFTVADLAGLLAAQPAATTTHFVFLLRQGMTVAQAAATTIISLDGLHLNSRGQSLAANAFLAAINAQLDLTGDELLAPVAAASWDPTYPAP